MSVSTETIQKTVSQILTEDVLTLQDARREIASATGRRPDKCTIYRWCLKGVGGTKLEHIRLGDRILTSRQAITRFITARSK
ncbi:MAG TPA: hypothetical protein DDZ51_18125 [Planctomycetaceae bacterium]|nr:hypothetical protein [Planctomycetaceae bacterium]